MPVRLIQIGLGGWGRNWVEEVTRETPRIQPVAWVDIDPATRERAVVDLELPEERVFASLEEALARVSADAALVVVPLSAHAPVTRQVLEAGLHVLVEKPFTETLEQARALEELASRQARAHGESELSLVPAPPSPGALCTGARWATWSPAISTSTSISAPGIATR